MIFKNLKIGSMLFLILLILFLVMGSISASDDASDSVSLETNDAKVTNVDAWGQRTLAYEIKKGNDTYKSGYYYVINIEANDDKAVKEFDRLALISSDIIRHLIIRKEK